MYLFTTSDCKGGRQCANETSHRKEMQTSPYWYSFTQHIPVSCAHSLRDSDPNAGCYFAIYTAPYASVPNGIVLLDLANTF